MSTSTRQSNATGSLEDLFVANVDSVFNVAYRVLWNRADAEDVVQRTFIKAITKLDQLRDAGRVRPWLLQVAYREGISVLRSRRDVPTDPFDLAERAVVTGGATAGRMVAGPAQMVIANDVVAILNRALGAMEDQERLAVVLRDVEELPMKQVAEVLGIGLSAAKMRVHRGRQSLRQLVAGQDLL